MTVYQYQRQVYVAPGILRYATVSIPAEDISASWSRLLQGHEYSYDHSVLHDRVQGPPIRGSATYLCTVSLSSDELKQFEGRGRITIQTYRYYLGGVVTVIRNGYVFGGIFIPLEVFTYVSTFSPAWREGRYLFWDVTTFCKETGVETAYPRSEASTSSTLGWDNDVRWSALRVSEDSTVEPVTESDLARIGPELVSRCYTKHEVPPGMIFDLYCDALEQAICTNNNVGNCLEVIDLVNDIRRGAFFQAIPKLSKISKLKDLGSVAGQTWLTKRYGFDTTRSDIEELCRRKTRIRAAGTTLRAGAVCSTGEMHLKVVATPVGSSWASDLASAMASNGFFVDDYVLWDAIPLSFIVDWFSDFGKYLEAEHRIGAIRQVFNVGAPMVSWKWTDVITSGEYLGYRVSHYQRWFLSSPPSVQVDREDPSSKTVIKRCIDAVSLIFS